MENHLLGLEEVYIAVYGPVFSTCLQLKIKVFLLCITSTSSEGCAATQLKQCGGGAAKKVNTSTKKGRDMVLYLI